MFFVPHEFEPAPSPKTTPLPTRRRRTPWRPVRTAAIVVASLGTWLLGLSRPFA